MSANLFPIERGVPLPIYRRNRKYPWHDMNPGDSFFVPCGKWEIVQLESSLTSCRNWQQKKFGWKFSMHRTTTGIRVWRVK